MAVVGATCWTCPSTIRLATLSPDAIVRSGCTAIMSRRSTGFSPLV